MITLVLEPFYLAQLIHYSQTGEYIYANSDSYPYLGNSSALQYVLREANGEEDEPIPIPPPVHIGGRYASNFSSNLKIERTGTESGEFQLRTTILKDKMYVSQDNLVLRVCFINGPLSVNPLSNISVIGNLAFTEMAPNSLRILAPIKIDQPSIDSLPIGSYVLRFTFLPENSTALISLAYNFDVPVEIS